MASYDKAAVRDAAEGNWLAIFARLAPSLENAIRRVGRHVPCPINGGTDGFRLMPDADMTGAAFHNDPRIHFLSNGFEVLMWIRGWSFGDTVNEIGEALGVKPNPPMGLVMQKRAEPTAIEGNARNYDGVLLDHGAARYQYIDKNEKSYFAVLRYYGGYEKTLWGVDIERALAEGNAQIGDDICLSNLGRVPVTLTVEVTDKQGIVTEQEIQTHRNTWEVRRIGHNRVHASASQAAPTREVKVANGTAIYEPIPAHAGKPMEHAEPTATPLQPSGKNVYPFPNGQDAPAWLKDAKQRAEKQMAAKKAGKAYASEKVEKVWNQCLVFPSPAAEPMRLYLMSRGLLFNEMATKECSDMRFHPALEYYEEKNEELILVGRFPAIVCAIRSPSGEIITLHRTYLDSKGRKLAAKFSDKQGNHYKVENVKKMMSIPEGLDINGSAVRLGDPSTKGILGVAEGLETALSAYRATKIPVWSTVNAQLMETFEIPEEVHTLLIWADKDKSLRGEIAAIALEEKARNAGVNVIKLMPSMPIPGKTKGVDWNDVLMTQGILGFPRIANLMNHISKGLASL